MSPTETSTSPEQLVEPKADRGVGQVYLLFAISACLTWSFGAVPQFFSDNVNLAIIETLLIFLPAVVFVRLKRLPIAPALGWRPISLPTALVSIVLGVSSLGIGAEIVSLSTPYIGSAPQSGSFNLLTPREFVIELLCSSILPGVCEETLFRGAIQGTLSRLGPSKSVLITAVLFALCHLNPWHFLAPLFWGVLFGILTFRSGSTIPAVIAHASTNATASATNYLIGHDPAVLSGIFVVVFSIYLAKTRDQAAPPRLLASANAALSRRALAATVASTLIVGGLVYFEFSAGFAWHVVTEREEIAGLRPGDHVLLVKGPLAQIGLAEGDIVEIEPEGNSKLFKVEFCTSTRIWLVGWPDSVPLDRREITGRVIRVRNESN